MSVEQLGAIAGIVLSLALAYIPKLKDWYDQKSATEKAQIMAALLIVSAAGVFALSCVKWFVLVACTEAGLKDLVGILIAALIANQSAFLLLVKPYKE